MLKIVASLGIDKLGRPEFDDLTNELNNADYQFTLFDHRKHLGGLLIENAWMLDRMFWAHDERLFATYNALKTIIDESGTDVLMVGGDNVYHPEFLKNLNVYTLYMSTDDPTSSYMRTVPYVWAFDHLTCCVRRYHEKLPVPMTDKLLEWGARRANWMPLGVTRKWYNPELTEQMIIDQERPLDLIYVGGAYRGKIDTLLKFKRALGPKLKIYGRWNWKPHAYALVRYGEFIRVRPISVSGFVNSYQATKIGINMHLDGPLGNGRLYQLPINGVMQICDCDDALGEVFEAGKEIIGYRTVDEGVDFIKYYLQHDDERKKIAAAGFRRALRDYNVATVYHQILEEVKKGMIEDGMRTAKDGTCLSVG